MVKFIGYKPVSWSWAFGRPKQWDDGYEQWRFLAVWVQRWDEKLRHSERAQSTTAAPPWWKESVKLVQASDSDASLWRCARHIQTWRGPWRRPRAPRTRGIILPIWPGKAFGSLRKSIHYGLPCLGCCHSDMDPDKRWKMDDMASKLWSGYKNNPSTTVSKLGKFAEQLCLNQICFV